MVRHPFPGAEFGWRGGARRPVRRGRQGGRGDDADAAIAARFPNCRVYALDAVLDHVELHHGRVEGVVGAACDARADPRHPHQQKRQRSELSNSGSLIVLDDNALALN